MEIRHSLALHCTTPFSGSLWSVLSLFWTWTTTQRWRIWEVLAIATVPLRIAVVSQDTSVIDVSSWSLVSVTTISFQTTPKASEPTSNGTSWRWPKDSRSSENNRFVYPTAFFFPNFSQSKVLVSRSGLNFFSLRPPKEGDRSPEVTSEFTQLT